MTRAQDRSRERRQAERLAAKEAARAAEQRRNRVVAAVVVGVLVLVTGFVWLATSLGNRDAAPAANPTVNPTVNPTSGETAAPTTTASPSTTASPTSTKPALAKGCTAPPAAQESARVVTTSPDVTAVQGKKVTATLGTTCGDITLDLFADKAPNTVASFVNLAKDGFWEPSPCHRLVTEGIFVLQCGDPTGTGAEGPGYTFGVENTPPKDNLYTRGTLAMARTQEPNSNGSQFFIVWKDTTLADPTGYTVFGKVTKGLDIVDRIAKGGIAEDGVAPALPISILTVDATAKG